jgi:hypothetical protein
MTETRGSSLFDNGDLENIKKEMSFSYTPDRKSLLMVEITAKHYEDGKQTTTRREDFLFHEIDDLRELRDLIGNAIKAAEARGRK